MIRRKFFETLDFALRSLTKLPLVNRIFHVLSYRYLDIYRGFSYQIEKNGESALIKHLITFMPENMVFFDVGANTGKWSKALFSTFPNSVGHLFEMSDNTFDQLATNFAGNNQILLNRAALSDSNGILKYKEFGNYHGGNTLLMNADYHSSTFKIRKAPSIKGDYYCQEQNVDRINLLKIDAEGSEYAVLHGFSRMLSKNLIDVVQFEYGYTHGDVHTLMRDFFKLLKDFGYVLGPLRDHGVVFKDFTYTDNDFKSGPNYIACLPQFFDQLRNFKDKHA